VQRELDKEDHRSRGQAAEESKWNARIAIHPAEYSSDNEKEAQLARKADASFVASGEQRRDHADGDAARDGI
jgi:hypothetical protein